VQRTKLGVEQAEEFGRRVRQFRTKKGVSQETLGELSELHRTHIP
jgi:transcriptional regulator with XRE-family HTH domain